MNSLFTAKDLKSYFTKELYKPTKEDALMFLEDADTNQIIFFYNKSTKSICVQDILINKKDY